MGLGGMTSRLRCHHKVEEPVRPSNLELDIFEEEARLHHVAARKEGLRRSRPSAVACLGDRR